MKIFGITLVKNEADILMESLSKAAVWCDGIFVYDTGSEDGSWDLVLEMAKKNSKIVPFLNEKVAFSDGLRARVFHQYRCLAEDGDWWCRLDSDEIYIDDPRIFLARVPRKYGVVYSASFQYYFTEKELSDYTTDAALFLGKPIEKRIRHYLCNWSEIRFFKHHRDLVWKGGHWPSNFGPLYKKRIRLKHFQYRSPEQIQIRLNSRLKAYLEDPGFFGYDAKHDWCEKIQNSANLKHDNLDGKYRVEEINLPQFQESIFSKYWGNIKKVVSVYSKRFGFS